MDADDSHKRLRLEQIAKISMHNPKEAPVDLEDIPNLAPPPSQNGMHAFCMGLVREMQKEKAEDEAIEEELFQSKEADSGSAEGSVAPAASPSKKATPLWSCKLAIKIKQDKILTRFSTTENEFDTKVLVYTTRGGGCAGFE